jgi:hypothetical protein
VSHLPRISAYPHGHIINIDGSKFYDFSPEHSKGGSGAIDLVMHVNQCNFRQAVVWLHERFGESGATWSKT